MRAPPHPYVLGLLGGCRLAARWRRAHMGHPVPHHLDHTRAEHPCPTVAVDMAGDDGVGEVGGSGPAHRRG